MPSLAAIAGRGEEVAVASLVEKLRALGGPAGSVAASSGGRASGWSAVAPPGEGRLVRVRMVADTPLKGVRAFIALQKARTLGEVTATSPAAEAIQADAFGDDFALRLVSRRDDTEIVAAIRGAGDVAEVVVDSEHLGEATPGLVMGSVSPSGTAEMEIVHAGGPPGNTMASRRPIRVTLPPRATSFPPAAPPPRGARCARRATSASTCAASTP